MAWLLSNSAGKRCHLLVSTMSNVRKNTTGSLAEFPVQVVPKHSQYSLRMARHANMPLCCVVPYSRLKACESCGLRFRWEAANCDGASPSEAASGVTTGVGCERGERRGGALWVVIRRRLMLVSEATATEAFRLCWLCGADSGESTGAEREVSHWASCSVHPGIATRR